MCNAGNTLLICIYGIILPNTNKSFVHTKPPWSTIFGHKLKFVYQLVNFNFSNYKGTEAKNADPEVNQLR